MITFYKSGIATDTLQSKNLIQFQAQFLGATDRVSHLRLPFTTVGYQVTEGKTLYLVKLVDLEANALAANFKIGYCDNDVGFDTVTARTNPVMSVGQDDAAFNGLTLRPNDSTADAFSSRWRAKTTLFIACAIAGKFPFIRRVSTGVGGGFVAWGVEL